MNLQDLVGLVAVVSLFIVLPWVVLHHITKWKMASSLTHGDEALLEELYQLARRLDGRMDTVERLVASDHPEFQPGLPLPDAEIDNLPLREIDRMRAQRQGAPR